MSAAPATAAQTLTLVAEESFNYSGNIVGQNGGTGFTNAWQDAYYNVNGTSNYSIQTPGLTYSGLTTVGGYIYSCSSTPNQVCGVSRQIPVQNSGVTYIQLLVHFGTQYGSGTPNLRFNNSAGARVGGLGSNGGTYGAKVSILDENMAPKSDGTSSAGLLNTLNLVILRIDYSQNKTSLYLNPNLSTFSYLTPPTADGNYPGLAPEIKTIEFFARNGVQYDELKVYNVSGTSASEDAAASEAARKKSEVQRAAAVKVAREKIYNSLERDEIVTNQDLIDADLPINSVDSLMAVYKELIAIRSSLTQPLSTEAVAELKFNKFMKYAMVERITGINIGTVYGRDLVNFGLIDESTPMKQLATYRLMKLPQTGRDSIEKINKYFAESSKFFTERKARIATLFKKK
jgi:hypothetical protein